MDEITRQYIVSSIRGVFDRWFWPPELFIQVFQVVPACRLEDKEKYDPETGSPDSTLITEMIRRKL